MPSKHTILRVDKIDLSRYDLDLLEMETYDTTADYSKTNICVQGMGGSCKTGELVKNQKIWLKNELHARAIAYTNVAKENLIHRGLSSQNVSTIHSLLGFDDTFEQTRQMFKSTQALSIDEHSMITTDLWLRIQSFLNVTNAYVHTFGDLFQCPPVSKDSIFKYRYNVYKTQFLKEFLGKNGKLLFKKYDNQTGRCDKAIRKIVKYVKKYKRLPSYLFTSEYDWLWDTSQRDKIDTIICQRRNTVTRENERLNADGIKIGSRIIHNKNNKMFGVFNGERYTVKKIFKQDRIKYITGIKWDPDPTKRNRHTNEKTMKYCDVTLANAETTYKYQAMTLYEDVLILEIHRMSLQEFLTTITRPKELKQIRFVGKKSAKKHYFYDVYKNQKKIEIKLKQASMFNLYLIKENNERGYIGFTHKTIDERFEEHQKPENTCKCNDFDWSKSTIQLLGRFIGINKKQCEKIEDMFIQDYNKFSNLTIVNHKGNNQENIHKPTKTKPTKTKPKRKPKKMNPKDAFKIVEQTKRNEYIIRESKTFGTKRISRSFKKRSKSDAWELITQVRNNLLKTHFPNDFK